MIEYKSRVVKAVCDNCGTKLKKDKYGNIHYANLQLLFGYGHPYDADDPSRSVAVLCGSCYAQCAVALGREPGTWKKRPKRRYKHLTTPFDALYKGGDKVDAWVEKHILGHTAGKTAIRVYHPSQNLNQAVNLLDQFLAPVNAKKVKDKFTLDSLGYRCCEADKDGMHGRWRCWVSEMDTVNGYEPSIFATADTPAMAVCKAAIQIWMWLKKSKRV